MLTSWSVPATPVTPAPALGTGPVTTVGARPASAGVTLSYTAAVERGVGGVGGDSVVVSGASGRNHTDWRFFFREEEEAAAG